MDASMDVQNKIALIDTHFQNMYLDTASYLKQLERTRIKSERLASHLKDYAAVETPGLKQSLISVSEILQQAEDRRKEMYDRIEIKMFQGLCMYESHCKDARSSLSSKTSADKACAVKEKELTSVNAKFKGDLNKVSTARSALARAQQDKRHASQSFASHLENFEKQKVRDLKSMWGDYIHAHILYYSRCLELMTKAQSLMMMVDEEEEMETVLKATRQIVLAVEGTAADGSLPSADSSPMASPDMSRRSSLRDSLGSSGGMSAPNTPGMNRRTTQASLSSSQGSYTDSSLGRDPLGTSSAMRRASMGSVGRDRGASPSPAMSRSGGAQQRSLYEEDDDF